MFSFSTKRNLLHTNALDFIGLTDLITGLIDQVVFCWDVKYTGHKMSSKIITTAKMIWNNLKRSTVLFLFFFFLRNCLRYINDICLFYCCFFRKMKFISSSDLQSWEYWFSSSREEIKTDTHIIIISFLCIL
jgi:hypothetical protein